MAGSHHVSVTQKPGPCFHLAGFNVGTGSLSHSHILQVAKAWGSFETTLCIMHRATCIYPAGQRPVHESRRNLLPTPTVRFHVSGWKAQ